MTKKNVSDDEIVFVDSRGKKWNKICLKELVDSLHKIKENKEIVDYYFD